MLAVMVIAGCVSSESYVCGDRVCPAGQVCASIPHATNSPTPDLCVEPSALTECDGKAENDACDAGVCHDGVCIAAECGNGFVDPGEQCDDHNQASGDGCSADCTSNETCGNGHRDGVKDEECDDGNLLSGDGCDSLCRVETARWANIAINAITQRTTGTMVFDASRGELLAYGGVDTTTSAVLTETWRFTGSSWLATDSRTAPIGGTGAASAYDAAHHQVVLFGGIAGGTSFVQSDTYLWNGRDWRFATPHDSPVGLVGASMVYDSKRGRAVMFGGAFKNVEPGYVPSSLMYAWDGADWTTLTPATVPPIRVFGSMSYDPLRDQIVLFGGTASPTVNLYTSTPGETWVYDGTDWHRAATTGPTARFNAKMAWDPITHTTLLFGGNTSVTANQHSFNTETWAWNGTAWTKLSPQTIPPGRDGQLMATDPERGMIRMYGGTTSASDPRTWSWNGANWIDTTPLQADATSANQTPRDDARGRSIFVTGPTWEFDGLGWIQNAAGLGETSSRFEASYDLARHQMIEFGGGATTTESYDGTTWTPHTPSTSPPERALGAMTYDRDRQRSVMFGGEDSVSGQVLGDTWEWDGTTWAESHPTHMPPPRHYSQLVYDPITKVSVLYGGSMDLEALEDTWTWDGTDWMQLPTNDPSHAPPGAASAAAIWVPRRQSVVVFSGGGTTSSSTASTWEYHLGQWSAVDLEGVPPPPHANSATLLARDGSLMLWSGTRQILPDQAFSWGLSWQNAATQETCVVPLDLDGDGLVGCDDPDCYYVCNPTCIPGTVCDATQPHCGDGVCSDLENCRMCPGDCGTCTAVCGDTFCDPGETPTSCPGDCH
ncbi:MAG: hypothetical protein QM831_35525 [Kofleriaceae bacterium]